MTEYPVSLLGKWVDRVNKKDMTGVTGMYGGDSTLVPTFSPRCLATKDEIGRYFEGLSLKKGLRVEVEEETVRTQRIGDSQYILTGMYTFGYLSGDGERSFPSRFTFVMDTASESPILHHHSSQVP